MARMNHKQTEWVVLTGASSGIGKELAPLLRAAGFGVIAIGRNQEALAQLANGDPLMHVRVVDLADPIATEAIALEVAEGYSLVGLINNAGVQDNSLLWSQSADDIDQEIRINLTAPAILCARLMQILPESSGFIVNVTSGLAIAPKSTSAVYCATKAGLRNLTVGIANQLMDGNRVAMIDVVLPLVDTPMTAGRGAGKITAKTAASAIMAAIASPKPVIWVGKAKLLALINRLAPSLAARIMAKS
jgi:uncharacterized oxidoreductase